MCHHLSNGLQAATHISVLTIQVMYVQVKRLSWQAGQDISKRGKSESSERQYDDSAATVTHPYKRAQPLSCDNGCLGDDDLVVELQPMDIRTFQLSLAA